MKVNIVYTTTGSVEEAERIGTELVRLRLAACVNIVDNMRAIYRWEGKICNEQEAIMIAKTQSSRVDDLIATIKSLHSYDCPCIISVPVAGGNPQFLDWIEHETSCIKINSEDREE